MCVYVRTLCPASQHAFVPVQKITTKNAFGLHLIDYMADILKQKDSELTNFKVKELFDSQLLLLIDVQKCLTCFG